jgi:hypothetical protein
MIFNRATAICRKETDWDLGTGYPESLDVNEQLDQLITRLHGKEAIIKEIKELFDVECKFIIAVIIEGGLAPALYLDKEVMRFALGIEAEMDIDLYANPYS